MVAPSATPVFDGNLAIGKSYVYWPFIIQLGIRDGVFLA
jgi:hypothetical protein